MSPKGLAEKAFGLQNGTIGRWWAVKEAEPGGKRLGDWGHTLDGAIRILAPSLPLSFIYLFP